MSAPVTDPIEDLLAAALADARTDDRWAIAPKAQALTSVRRAATRQRSRNAGVALTAVAAAATGAAFGLNAVGPQDSTGQVLVQPGDGGDAPAPTPAPGISPDWIPRSGADWFLDKPAFDAFVAGHTLPSDKPNNVQSPAPLTELSERLESDVRFVMPKGTSTTRQDAPDGDPSAAAVHAQLADGTPVEIRRQQLWQPLSSQYDGDTPSRRTTRRALPSGSVLVTIAHTGYGWGPSIPEGANTALVITRSGTETTWNVPLSIPLSTVAEWAAAADNG